MRLTRSTRQVFDFESKMFAHSAFRAFVGRAKLLKDINECIFRRYLTTTNANKGSASNDSQPKTDHVYVSKTHEEYVQQRKADIEQPEHARFIRVAVLGMPNAGKSTLANSLIQRNISAVSKKAHTTKSNVIGIFTERDTQVELTDTPGIVAPGHLLKHRLEPTFLRDPIMGCQYCDMLAVVVDCQHKKFVRISKPILHLLYKHREKKSILIMNKIDLVKAKRDLIDISNTLTNGGYINGQRQDSKERNLKLTNRYMKLILEQTEMKEKNVSKESSPNLEDEIEEITAEQKGWSYFSRVFMVSALTDDGVDDLKKFIVRNAKANKWLYQQNMASNRSPQRMVIDILKSKMLDNVEGDIPYTMEYKINEWEVTDEGELRLLITAKCAQNYQISKVIGPRGVNISKIVEQAIIDLSKLFSCQVDIKLVIDVASPKKK